MHGSLLWRRRYHIAAGLLGLLLVSGSALGFPKGSSSHFVTPSSLTHQVFRFVDWKYVDPDRSRPEDLLEGAFKHLENRYPEILIDWNRSAGKVTVRFDEQVRGFDLSEGFGYAESAQLLEDILSFTSPLLEDEVEPDLLRYMTINGALSELDPHSNVFSQKHYKDFKVRTSGSFGGIGFTFGIHEGDLVIISPIPDTPADRAGLKSGDKIVFIDGEPTTNMGTDAAVSKMRGEPDTEVTLTIAREGWTEPRDFRITREIIHIVSVEAHVLSGDGEPAAIYIGVKNFQENTADELRRAIEEHDSPEIAGVVIDLRNNPGGLLQQAIEVSEGFLDEGTIVATRSRDRKSEPRVASAEDPLFTPKPVIVLINRGSASASEIVAAALQESRAVVIGQTSFGKGSVQQAYQLMDGGGLLLTVSQYLTPGDVSIQSIGIQPDIVVDAVEVEKGRLRLGPIQFHGGEASLDNAFTEWGNAKRTSESRLEYLKTPEEKAEGFKAPTKEEKVADLAGQFEVRLARRILGAVDRSGATADRKAVLPAARKVVAELDLSEKHLIAEAFSGLGVDWSLPAADGQEPRLTLAFPGEFTIQAGSKASLSLTVRNEGEGTAYQVWGDTDSENPLLKNLDFAFGRIEPGEEKTWTADLDVPKSAENRWDTLTVSLKSARQETAGTFTGSAMIRSMVTPDFEYSYTMEDVNPDDAGRSGDGILEAGERARLKVTVRNRGAADSAAVDVNLHSVEGQDLYLDEVRQRVDGIPAAGSVEVPLSFRLIEAGKEGEVEVRLSFSDKDNGVFFSDALKFRTGEPYPRIQSRVPPEFTLRELPPPITGQEAVTLRLEVRDDEEVKEIYAYRGDKKIFYSANRDRGSSLPIEIEVPLEEGSNRIVVVARDQKNIVAQKTFYINRNDSGSAFSEVLSSEPGE